MAAEEYEQIRQMSRTDGSGTVTAVDDKEDGEDDGIPAPGEVDFDALHAINSDIVGWIQFKVKGNKIQ